MAREHTGAWSARRQAELENRIVLLQASLKYMKSLSEQAGQKAEVFTSFECIQTGDKCKFLKFCAGDRGGDQA